MLGHKIIVHTDHKNLTYDSSNYSSDRVLRQRLIIKEYRATLKYVKGDNNVIADALSWLPIHEGAEEELMMLNKNISTADEFAYEELFLKRRVYKDQLSFPLDLAAIKELQDKDKELDKMIRDPQKKGKMTRKKVQGTKSWTTNGKVFVPSNGRVPMIEWYQDNLQHARVECSTLYMWIWFVCGS